LIAANRQGVLLIAYEIGVSLTERSEAVLATFDRG
jgi:hypothetical protein